MCCIAINVFCQQAQPQTLQKLSSAVELNRSTREREASCDLSVDISQCVGSSACRGGGPDGQTVAAAGVAAGDASGNGNGLVGVSGFLAVDSDRAREGETRDWGAGH